MLIYTEFLDQYLTNEQDQQDRDYIETQIRWLYDSYRRLVPHISPGDTILSVGIGVAYLESAIAEAVAGNIFGK